MYAWATSFKDLIVSRLRATSNTSTEQDLDIAFEDDLDPVSQDLAELLQLAEIQEKLYDASVVDSQILLPPKQFLPMFHTRFFHQNDWSTDLFVQSKFWENVDRVYSNYVPNLDEPWAIVFNTIILLSLSAEGSFHGHGTLTTSHFAAPFFSAIRVALNRIHLLMSPRLINVQALALLSLAAELFYPFGVAEAVFVQACNLARRMGLNQVDIAGDRYDPSEEEERIKVSRSLYIRDKSLGISRGTVCWLPGFEIQKMNLGDTDSPEGRYHAARVTITAFQERVYRLHSSANAQDDFANKAGFHPSGIQSGLADLLEIGTICGAHLELWLEFLATRIVALRRNPKPRYARRTLQDCRACCILLLMAFGKSDQAMRQRLELHYDLQTPTQRPNSTFQDNEPNVNDQTGFMPRNLLNIFPVSALFLLAANIINPTFPGQDISEDLDLLLRVSNCYKEADESLQAINRAHQVGRALEKLLSIIDHVRGIRVTPSLSKTPTSATTSSRTQSASGSSSHVEAADPFIDLSGMPQAPNSEYATSHNVSKGHHGVPISSLGMDDIEAFIMNTPSGADLGSSFSLDSNMMPFMAQSAIAPNQFPTDNYGMDICYPNDSTEPKSGLGPRI
jgi:hypothetical protein